MPKWGSLSYKTATYSKARLFIYNRIITSSIVLISIELCVRLDSNLLQCFRHWPQKANAPETVVVKI